MDAAPLASANLGGPSVAGIPVVYALLAATLVGLVAVHRRALEVSLAGLAAIVLVQGGLTNLDLARHFAREWSELANLLGLVVGFALLADHLERSGLPERLPRVLPRGARGAFALLAFVWGLSGLVDNIASALLGATLASNLYGRRVHLGYVAALVAAANAGGAGSVLGDTTTTMIWLEGVSPLDVLPAYVGSAVALVVFGVAASAQQARHAPAPAVVPEASGLDGGRLAVVGLTLLAVVVVNVAARRISPQLAKELPLLALAVWVALVAGALVRPPSWRVVPGALKSGLLLVALVAAASLMPIEALPSASWRTTLALGFVSAIFDNIPLTKLALEQGGHDPSLLAYALGVGGSMLWFGSSAGVAVAGLMPEARSTRRWLSRGWHVPLAFVAGFFALLAVRGLGPR